MVERPIVIVEDNAYERELISSALTGYDLSKNVIELSSGAAVHDYIRGNPPFESRSVLPSLVILDLELEDTHGLEVLKEIRSDAVMGKVPVVVLSGSESALDAAVARELGANGFVVKPSEFYDLQAAVRSLAVFWASQDRQQTSVGSGHND